MEKKHPFNLFCVILAILGVLVLQNLLMSPLSPQIIPYSDFIQAVVDDRVKESFFKTVRVDSDLATKLSEHHVKYSGEIENTFFRPLFSWLFPIALFYLIWFFIMRRMQFGAA